jgi:mannose-6-phosphate isomerase-like protein (cupin superfamily)
MEWWNSPDDVSVSVAHVRVEPGGVTRRHFLEGVAERYVILKGKGRVEVGNLPPEDVGQGDVVFIPPGVSQKITNLQDGMLRAVKAG